MALRPPIQIRLNPLKHLQYEDEAQRLNKPLSTYLRERLEARDAMGDELAALRQEVAQGFHVMRQMLTEKAESGSAVPTSSQTNDALLLEILVLLRQIGGPEKIKMAQAELKRQGMKAWTPN